MSRRQCLHPPPLSPALCLLFCNHCWVRRDRHPRLAVAWAHGSHLLSAPQSELCVSSHPCRGSSSGAGSKQQQPEGIRSQVTARSLSQASLWLLSSGLWPPATQWVLAGTCNSGGAVLWVKQILLSGCEAYSIRSCKPGQKVLELLLFQDDLLNGIANVFITF